MADVATNSEVGDVSEDSCVLPSQEAALAEVMPSVGAVEPVVSPTNAPPSTSSEAAAVVILADLPDGMLDVDLAGDDGGASAGGSSVGVGGGSDGSDDGQASSDAAAISEEVTSLEGLEPVEDGEVGMLPPGMADVVEEEAEPVEEVMMQEEQEEQEIHEAPMALPVAVASMHEHSAMAVSDEEEEAEADEALAEALRVELTAGLYSAKAAVRVYPSLMYRKLELPLDDHIQLLGRADTMAAANILMRGHLHLPMIQYLFPHKWASSKHTYEAQVRWFFLTLVSHFMQRGQVWAYVEDVEKPPPSPATGDSDDEFELPNALTRRVLAVALWEPAHVTPIRVANAFSGVSTDFLLSVELDEDKLERIQRILRLMHDMRVEDTKKYFGRDYACLHCITQDPAVHDQHIERLLLQSLCCYSQQLTFAQAVVASGATHAQDVLFQSQGLEHTWRIALPDETAAFEAEHDMAVAGGEEAGGEEAGGEEAGGEEAGGEEAGEVTAKEEAQEGGEAPTQQKAATPAGEAEEGEWWFNRAISSTVSMAGAAISAMPLVGGEEAAAEAAAAEEEDTEEQLTALLCFSNHMNVPSAEEEAEITRAYVEKHGVDGLEGDRGSPAYLLAAGPPRVCAGCKKQIELGNMPFPDGTKPKAQVMKELQAMEVKRLKEERKKKGSKEAADAGVAPEVPTDGEEVDIDLSDDSQAQLTPLEMKKKQKRKGLGRKIVAATTMTASSTGSGVVSGMVVGGATGFLLGIGPIGLVAGVVGGAVLGGAAGAGAGAYAGKAHIDKVPKKCGLCNTVFKKNTLKAMPYQCRSCWVWCCDGCVCFEALQDGSQFMRPVSFELLQLVADAHSSRTAASAAAPVLLSSRQQGERPSSPSVRRSGSFSRKELEEGGGAGEGLMGSEKKPRKASKLSSLRRILPKQLESADKVSRPLPMLSANCSWCFKMAPHLCTEKSHVPGIRSIWQCQECNQRTLRCRMPKCPAMSRGLLGYDEELCWKCQKKITSWEDGLEGTMHLARNARCSWCFEFTIHDPMCHAPVIKVYKCRGCRQTTVPCTKCPKGDGWAMARDNGFLWKGKCALHAKHIKSWDDPEENRRLSELRDLWCSWCVQVTTHATMGPGGLINRRRAYLCNNCHQRTYLCKAKCNRGMARHGGHRCLECKLSSSGHLKRGGLSFPDVLANKDEVYAMDWDPIRELERDSPERAKARKIGYLRPFLLLASMEPPVRVLAAASIGIDLIRRTCFGDAHKEALLIIVHPRLGLMFRTRSSYEEVYRARTTWYTSLHRVMTTNMKSTTFKDKPAWMTKKACNSAMSDILPELELEFLEKLSHWQHLMATEEVSNLAEQIMVSPEFMESLEELDELGLSTPPIRLLLAEMMAEATLAGQKSEDILVNTEEFSSFISVRDDEDVVSTVRTGMSTATDLDLRGIKSEVAGGLGSTYKKKSQVVYATVAAIPAGYVKMALWYFVGLALASFMGPMGWVLEWVASIALGTVLTAWVLGEVYLGESHEEMMPLVVIICVQRLTLATAGTDIRRYLDGYVEEQVEERAPLEEFNFAEEVSEMEDEDGLWAELDCEDLASDEEGEFVDALMAAHAQEIAEEAVEDEVAL